jgi:predicted NAD-dependent protein-ADP-ribosyltransferase YbiA (DUF1768 family)
MTIYFLIARGDYRSLFNFPYHSFELDGENWPTTEHYSQAQKMLIRLILTKLVRQKYVKTYDRKTAVETAVKSHARLTENFPRQEYIN